MCLLFLSLFFFFFKQKTAYEMRISDWSSDVCSSDLDAVIIDCMGDPGLKAAREVVSIPVLGPSETAMHLAAMLGHRFSIVTVLDSVVPMIDNLAKLYGMADKLASIRVIDIPVLDLESDRKSTRLNSSH